MNDNKNNDNVNFGDTVKGIRLSKGLSMAQFANLIGVSKGTVSLWEANKVTPHPAQQKKIEDIRSSINAAPTHELFFKLADMTPKARYDYITNEVHTLVRLLEVNKRAQLISFLVSGLPFEAQFNLLLDITKDMPPLEIPHK